MAYRCKSTLRIYEIGVEDRVYEALSSSSHSGTSVRQISGPKLIIEVIETRSALAASPRALNHGIGHSVSGMEELQGDDSALAAFRANRALGERRYAVTHHETFGENVSAGD